MDVASAGELLWFLSGFPIAGAAFMVQPLWAALGDQRNTASVLLMKLYAHNCEV